MEQNVTTQQEVHVDPYKKAVEEHEPAIGDVYCTKNPHGGFYKIFRLADRVETEYGPRWSAENILSSYDFDSISDDDLKRNYRPILNEFDKVKSLAEKVVDGEAEEVIKSLLGADASMSPSADTEALMASESPQRILAILDESERVQNLMEEIHLAAEHIIEDKKRELLEQSRKMDGVISAMRRKVEHLVRIITILNLYTGETVDVEQIADGEPADASEMLHLRQRILYMDEELCVHLDHEGDYEDIDEFKRWVSAPENRDIIAPEPRCIVALKPRRFRKEYRSGDRYWDAQRNVWNRHTYIIIRNGERLYMLDSEDLECWDWTFPHGDFEEKFQKEYNSSTWESTKEGTLHKHEDEKYRITKFMAFLQGVIDGDQQLLAPMASRPNLMKAEGIVLVRDDEDLIGTGRKSWREFREEKNASIRRGTRILYVPGGTYRESAGGRVYHKGGDFAKFYYHSYSEPDAPGTGIYHSDTIDVVDHYENHKPVKKTADYPVFRYLPGDKIWTRDSFEEQDRKNKVAWKYAVDHVLNYDAVTIEELKGYLEDRTLRVSYADMMPTLKRVLLEKIAERKDEEAFKALMAETIRRETGRVVGDEEMDEAISAWKTSVIYSRPLKSDDAKAFRMIKKQLLRK